MYNVHTRAIANLIESQHDDDHNKVNSFSCGSIWAAYYREKQIDIVFVVIAVNPYAWRIMILKATRCVFLKTFFEYLVPAAHFYRRARMEYDDCLLRVAGKMEWNSE